MNSTEIFNDIKDLCHKYNIGTVLEQPLEITGGLMHRMYKAITDTNVYGVKWLNPSIMQRDGVMDNMINSERIASAFSTQLPVVAALIYEGSTVLTFNDKYYMVFPWIEGVSIFPPNINDVICYEIGSVLGRMHQLNITVPKVKRELSNLCNYQWQEYLEQGKELNATWVDAYSSKINKLKNWNIRAKEANAILSENMVISHRDLDPKNVMWYQNKPYIIDWEAAGYINPYQELIEVINYWASNEYGELDQNKCVILLDAYNHRMSTRSVDWVSVLDSGYAGMLGWLEYSLKRALGVECSNDVERKLGAEQIVATIQELERYEKKKSLLKAWLIQK